MFNFTTNPPFLTSSCAAIPLLCASNKGVFFLFGFSWESSTALVMWRSGITVRTILGKFRDILHSNGSLTLHQIVSYLSASYLYGESTREKYAACVRFTVGQLEGFAQQLANNGWKNVKIKYHYRRRLKCFHLCRTTWPPSPWPHPSNPYPWPSNS